MSQNFDRMKENFMVFNHFTMNQWRFMANNNDKVLNFMSQNEKAEFNIDVMSIEWKKQLYGFHYGIRRYYFKEDVMSPKDEF